MALGDGSGYGSNPADVLVAESNAPPMPEDKSDGVRGWIQGVFMKRAGARTPSDSRITLLQDADGDGVSEFRSTGGSNADTKTRS